ncbi:unnamed protein product [Medioppia subpectinata]|uniref:Uncharacterized protein n=1 Tax=Medioppia subpectinata TaxID=1979941 RepID=A0A7R9PYY9_9ACAR|nr:unnamed protein product [Medioppia subpectinata]CAG2106371.1 unnamed protein product [Medioppia subpectinata]
MKTFCVFYLFVCDLFVSNGQDFCSDSHDIQKIFFMSDTNYIKKESLYYKQSVDKKFAGTKGVDHSVHFQPKFQRIETGFLVTKVSDKCKASVDCAKLLNTGFVIGDIASTPLQSYVAYRLGPDFGLVPAPNKWPMPYNMSLEGPIQVVPNVWPMTTTQDNRYLASAFDEQNQVIIFLVYKQPEQRLYFVSIDPSNQVMPETALEGPPYAGFFRFNSHVYALLVSSHPKKHQILSFNATLNKFTEEKNVNFDKDFLGCATTPSESTRAISDPWLCILAAICLLLRSSVDS